eukprot:jgi/Mesen1/710/ME000109S_10935
MLLLETHFPTLLSAPPLPASSRHTTGRPSSSSSSAPSVASARAHAPLDDLASTADSGRSPVPAAGAAGSPAHLSDKGVEAGEGGEGSGGGEGASGGAASWPGHGANEASKAGSEPPGVGAPPAPPAFHREGEGEGEGEGASDGSGVGALERRTTEENIAEELERHLQSLRVSDSDSNARRPKESAGARGSNATGAPGPPAGRGFLEGLVASALERVPPGREVARADESAALRRGRAAGAGREGGREQEASDFDSGAASMARSLGLLASTGESAPPPSPPQQFSLASWLPRFDMWHPGDDEYSDAESAFSDELAGGRGVGEAKGGEEEEDDDDEEEEEEEDPTEYSSGGGILNAIAGVEWQLKLQRPAPLPTHGRHPGRPAGSVRRKYLSGPVGAGPGANALPSPRAGPPEPYPVLSQLVLGAAPPSLPGGTPPGDGGEGGPAADVATSSLLAESLMPHTRPSYEVDFERLEESRARAQLATPPPPPPGTNAPPGVSAAVPLAPGSTASEAGKCTGAGAQAPDEGHSAEEGLTSRTTTGRGTPTPSPPLAARTEGPTPVGVPMVGFSSPPPNEDEEEVRQLEGFVDAIAIDLAELRAEERSSQWGRVGIAIQYRGRPLCLHDTWTRVRFSVGDKFAFDDAGRPKFSLLVEPSQATCDIIRAADSALLEKLGSGAEGQVAPTCRSSFVESKSELPALRIKIATEGAGEAARYKTRFCRQSGAFWRRAAQPFEISAVDPAAFRQALPAGSFVDLCFSVETYSFEGTRGLRFIAHTITMIQ